MKKLLFILLLLPSICFSQLTISRFSTSCCFTLGIASSGGITYSPGVLYIIFVGTSYESGGSTPATITLSGTGQTWDELASVGGVVNGSSFKRIQAFRYAPTSTNTNTVIFTIGGTGNQDGMWFELIQITGADLSGTNGNTAISQFIYSSANGADPTLTFGSVISTRSNGVVAGFINSVSPFGGSPESGYTELHQSGFSTPDTGVYMMSSTNLTDNTPTVTSSSGNWAGMAFEIKAARRQVRITN